MITSMADLVNQGLPILLWINRLDPFIVCQKVRAFSGRMAITKAKVTGKQGMTMLVNFRLTPQSYIVVWESLFASSSSFSTTSLASYFNTGYRVIFDPQTPIKYQSEILRDQCYDMDQTIFTTKPGLDYFMGEMRLIIVG